MSLPRYPRYGDSGERWLGTIPAHWDIHRLKNLFEIRKRIAGEEGPQVLSITQRGIKIKDIESNDGQLSMDYSKYQVVKPGDFAMNHMDLLTGFVDISSHAGVTSPDYRVFSIRDGVVCEPKYLLYLLQNGYRQKIFYAFGQGASEFGRWRFPTDQFNNFRFPCPPHEEQIAIVTFLDEETAKIDALIAEQEKLIALLAEKRLASISHAVTKGLNPNTPMKDSGVSWLGKVPVHWKVGKSRFYVSVLPGYAFPSAGFSTDERNVKLLRGINVAVGELRWDEVVYWRRTLADGLDPFELSVGDVVIGMDRPLISSGMRVAVVKQEDLPCMLLQRVAKVQPGPSIDGRFIMRLLSSRAFEAHFTPDTTGVSVPHISGEQISSFVIPVPPLDEQLRICDFLDAELAKLDALNHEAGRAIALLGERRSALIAAAVTGQIDVRDTAPLELAA